MGVPVLRELTTRFIVSARLSRSGDSSMTQFEAHERTTLVIRGVTLENLRLVGLSVLVLAAGFTSVTRFRA